MSGLIPLNSEEGLQLLKEVQDEGGPDQPILRQIFKKQKGRTTCGIQSSGLILDSFQIKQSGGINPDRLSYIEPKILEHPLTVSVVTTEEVNRGGSTLEQVGNVLKAHGKTTVVHHASDSSVQEFRDKATEALTGALSHSPMGVVVNYHMNVLGQGPFFGHHSPLGAYHKGRDMFLIMDTWPDTEVCWAKSEAIFKAMNTEDSAANGKTRGFVIVSESSSK